MLERRQADRRHDHQPHDPERRHIQRRQVGEKLECPVCHCLHSVVLPYHPTPEEQGKDAFWRRRECLSCHTQVLTAEYIERVLVRKRKPTIVRPALPASQLHLQY